MIYDKINSRTRNNKKNFFNDFKKLNNNINKKRKI